MKNLGKGRYNISAGYALADYARTLLLTRRSIDFLEDHLDAYSEDFLNQIREPQKKTTLHVFLESIESTLWQDGFGQESLDLDFDSISKYISTANIVLPDWFFSGNLDSHQQAVWKLIERAIPITVEAAFQLLFQDREFLFDFQSLVHDGMIQTQKIGIPVSRTNYLPTWLKKAVFYRDRGLCQDCGRDVSGLLNLEGALNLDHMRPLYQGGSNDPTNFQILCADCNQKDESKRAPIINRNHRYWN